MHYREWTCFQGSAYYCEIMVSKLHFPLLLWGSLGVKAMKISSASYPQHRSLYTAQVESVDVFYVEDEETKLVMWNTPEEEVTAYSIRISYYDNNFRQQFQYLRSDNPWIQLRLTDLPSQRPLWIEVI